MSNTSFLKCSFIFFICFLSGCNLANSQSNSSFPKKVFKTTVSTDAGSQHGYLYNVTDTSIQLSPNHMAYHDTLLSNNRSLKTFNYSNIHTVTVTRKGSVIKGVLFGALAGALVGLATYSKKDAFLGPAANVAAGAVVGAPIGLLIGSLYHEKAYMIYRDKAKFLNFQVTIRKRARERANVAL